jgi:hypothetical protein
VEVASADRRGYFEDKSNIGGVMTAVEQLYHKVKNLGGPYLFHHAKVLVHREAAKDLERQQHQRTWDAAIEAYISRGVKERAMVDFDDYEIK